MSFSLHNSRFGLYVDFTNPIQGQIQDLKFGEEHLQKLRRAEVDANFFGVFRVKNRDFTPTNHIFANFRGLGAGAPPQDPPLRSGFEPAIYGTRGKHAIHHMMKSYQYDMCSFCAQLF